MCLPVLCLCLSVDAETGPFTLSLIESCQTSTGGTQSLHACSAGKHSSGCWQVKAQEQKIISVLFLTARVYSSASQNYWLESKLLTRVKGCDFEPKLWLGILTRKNRVKISTRNSKSKFRIGTFESELSSWNFKSEVPTRNSNSELPTWNFDSKFRLEIQTWNFRLEILTRNSDLKFQVGTFRVGKFRLADEKTLSALAGPGCRKYCCVYFFALPLARALAVKNNVVFIFLLLHWPVHKLSKITSRLFFALARAS